MDKSFEERLRSIKEGSPTTKCTFGDENDREGFTYDIKDTDFTWLMSEALMYKREAESYSRVVEGFIADIEDLKARLIEIRNDVHNESLNKANDSLNHIIDFILADFDKGMKQ